MKAKTIRKEKAILIKKLQDEGDGNAYNEAGRIINEKYGKGWNERYSPAPSYDEWWSECNLDGSFAYNGVTDDF